MEKSNDDISIEETLKVLEDRLHAALANNVEFLLQNNVLARSSREPVALDSATYKEIRAMEKNHSNLIKKTIKEYKAALDGIDYIPGITEPKTLLTPKSTDATSDYSFKLPITKVVASPKETPPTKKPNEPEKNTPKKTEVKEEKNCLQKFFSCLMNFLRAIFPSFFLKKA